MEAMIRKFEQVTQGLKEEKPAKKVQAKPVQEKAEKAEKK